MCSMAGLGSRPQRAGERQRKTQREGESTPDSTASAERTDPRRPGNLGCVFQVSALCSESLRDGTMWRRA